jgi:hypothetical protein
MIATPSPRNRLMQMLKAETCVRRKTGDQCESGTDERPNLGKEGPFLGTLSPGPWDFTALMPIPVD